MNTPILSTELDPAERRRRAAALKRAEKICGDLGFRQVAGRPGCWYHEQGDPKLIFHLTAGQVSAESVSDVIGLVIFTAGLDGANKVRGQFRRALGL